MVIRKNFHLYILYLFALLNLKLEIAEKKDNEKLTLAHNGVNDFMTRHLYCSRPTNFGFMVKIIKLPTQNEVIEFFQ